MANTKKTPTARKVNMERLRECFDYDARTGLVTNRARRDTHIKGLVGSKRKEYSRQDVSTAWEGMPAEVLKDGRRYYEVKMDGRWLPAHRVAWALHYGEWPTQGIDHVNRDPLDNRIENLRTATTAQNARNRTKANAVSSQYLGVCQVGGSWRASITHAGVTHYLGQFENERDAALAYDAAAVTFHREFANPNIIENPYLTQAQK